MRRVIVVGASSGIGEALVAQLGAAGDRVVAVARRGELLAGLVGHGAVHPLQHDATDLDDVPRAFADAVAWLGGLDVLVYAAGVMPAVELDEFDAGKDADIFAVNLVGAAAWLDAAAPVLAAQGSGALVGIGSVAGERGRLGNPAYCASKAGLHALLEALRNRLDRRGVLVLTVKPGPVRTPMVAGRTDLPLLIEADDAAAQIVAALDAGRREVFVPWAWGPIMAVIRAIPSWIFRRLNV